MAKIQGYFFDGRLDQNERRNIRDMIDGSLNRIMITDDKEELLTMIASINYRMSLLAKDTMRRIDEQTYKEEILCLIS